MDLSTRLPNLTTDLVILDPQTGEETDIVITLAGPSHDVSIEFERVTADKRFSAGTIGQPMKLEQMLEDSSAEMVARTLAWKGVQWEGEPLECTPENVNKIYAHPGLYWLRGQVFRAMGANSRFFTN